MINKDYAAIEPAVKEDIGHMRRRMFDMLEAAAMLLGDESSHLCDRARSGLEPAACFISGPVALRQCLPSRLSETC